MLLAYFILVWLFSGFVAGLTSFGGNLVAVPLLALVLPPKEAVLFGCISCTAIFMALAVIYRRGIIWSEVLIYTISTLAGSPAGVWLLKNAGPRVLMLGAGATISFFLFWQFLSQILKASETPASAWLALPCGALSGAMMSALGMGGPPLALYAFLRCWNKEETLGALNAISVGFMLGVIPVQLAAGLYTAEIWRLGLICALFAILGVLLSIPLVRRMNVSFFRRLLLAMLAFSALMLFIKAL